MVRVEPGQSLKMRDTTTTLFGFGAAAARLARVASCSSASAKSSILVDRLMAWSSSWNTVGKDEPGPRLGGPGANLASRRDAARLDNEGSIVTSLVGPAARRARPSRHLSAPQQSQLLAGALPV